MDFRRSNIMKSFESLIKEIEQNKTIAETEIPLDADPRTLTTRIGQQKRAKQNLEDLFLEYRKHVGLNSVFILTKGKQYESFAQIAREEYNCFSVNADELYNFIADQIDPRNYTNVSAGPGLFDMFMSIFNDVCDQIGIISYPAILFESKYQRKLSGREDVIKLIKEAFNEKVGSEIVGLYAIDQVAKKAIESGYSGTTIPVILHSEDSELTETLENSLKNITQNVFMVSTTKKQTAKLVEEKLVKIKESLK